jgi:hypothetical protein
MAIRHRKTSLGQKEGLMQKIGFYIILLSAAALVPYRVTGQTPTQPATTVINGNERATSVSTPEEVTSQQIANLQRKLDDWAGLNRYQSENAKMSEPASEEKRVVFMGDSITDHWGRSGNHGSFFPGKPYVNRGISGQTTPQMLVRFQQDVLSWL